MVKIVMFYTMSVMEGEWEKIKRVRQASYRSCLVDGTEGGKFSVVRMKQGGFVRRHRMVWDESEEQLSRESP